MESLFKQQAIALRDLHSVYEALFLRAVTAFEGFLEEQFLSILRSKTKYRASRKIIVRMTAMPDALMNILLHGQPYMQWLPFKNTIDRAHVYLKDGRPFSEVKDADKQTLATITFIRNAIAHQSDYAMEKFNVSVIGSATLLPVERTPAGYLRSHFRPNQSRFEFYVSELGRIGKEISPP